MVTPATEGMLFEDLGCIVTLKFTQEDIQRAFREATPDPFLSQPILDSKGNPTGRTILDAIIEWNKTPLLPGGAAACKVSPIERLFVRITSTKDLER